MEIIQLLETNLSIFVLLSGLIGLIVGSFLNVVIHRLPKMMEHEWREQCATLDMDPASALVREAPKYNLLAPGSACPACGHQISAIENIPVLSYLVLGGRCRQCKASIGLRYPVVEILSGALCTYSAWHFGYGAQALVAPLLIWSLIALTFIDFDTQLLPDSITLPLIWLGLLVNLNLVFTSLSSAVIGAIAGYLSLWSVYWLFKLATGKEGMGFGDFKLLAVIGAWLGWQILPLTLLLSSIVGAVVGITLILFAGHGRQIPIPFGPYLAGGGLIALFWGKPLTQAYLGLAL